jgi:hypothetical protein
VFALHSIVNVEIPLQTTSFESRMYELLVQEVDVENPFSGDCDFTVSLMPFEHASDKAKKENHKASSRAPAVAKQRTGLNLITTGDEDNDKETAKKKNAVRWRRTDGSEFGQKGNKLFRFRLARSRPPSPRPRR